MNNFIVCSYVAKRPKKYPDFAGKYSPKCLFPKDFSSRPSVIISVIATVVIYRQHCTIIVSFKLAYNKISQLCH